jgi:hypothetical protein
MDIIMKENFLSNLQHFHTLSPQQQKNASRLIDVSKKFQKKAKISVRDIKVESEHTIILESGHQPNFLSHPGTWQKAFLLHRIHDTLKRDNNQSVAFFGLADQNISTARLLSKNQIPALNKDGALKIGFKIKDSDKFKSFCSVPKPSFETWQNEINKISQHYADIVKKSKSAGPPGNYKQWDQVLEILWDSYETATNFAELNGYIFARICNEILGLDLIFFLYSDMHHDNFFIHESRIILENLPHYNQKYNEVIDQKGLHIPHVTTDHLPFWYDCDCGAKIDLFLDNSFTSSVKCPLCAKEYHLDFDEGFKNLDKYYGRMDFNAVSRNMIMAQGLGDTLFISGSGGSLQYGLISDTISTDLGFQRPIGLSWRSQNLYLGMTHRAAVFELMKTFALTSKDFLEGSLNQKIAQSFHEMTRQIDEAQRINDAKKLKYWTGMLTNAKTTAGYCKKIFLVTPSIIDILINYERNEIMKSWENAIINSEIQEKNWLYQICADIRYPVHSPPDIQPGEIPVFYEQIRNIEVETWQKKS